MLKYTFRSKANPIGVASNTVQFKLPGYLKDSLPTAKQIATFIKLEPEDQ